VNANSAAIEILKGLEAHLLSRIKGQDHVIPRVCSVLERGQLGLQSVEKPLGSFLFLGPTGVGKTELTLEFTRYLFGNESVYRFDMSAGQREAVHGRRNRQPRKTRKSSLGAFCFSTKLKNPTA
jgi:ATP-dependent Clp protease ATP-binding subunit ClpA